jgi:hypothetical protein
MIDRFHRHVPALVKPETGASNSRELIFPGLESGYGVGTAGSKAGVGRSRALTLFHGSECAFWPSAKDHIAGVIQAVPYLEGTEIVLESTANGIGGEFHERWQQSSAGDGDYEAIFCPWFWDASYQRPPPLGFEVNDEEEEYGRLYKLTLPQLAWRRAKMAELGDVALWNQEYPADAQGAFQATGHDAYIPSALVMAARKRTCEAIGSLVLGVDPARLGDDGFAVCWRQGRKVHKVERRYKLDTIQGANWIRQIIDDDNPARVFIDVGGQGAGVVDLLKDWGPPYDRIVVAVNFGSAPEDPIRTGSRGETLPGPRNRRAEMYMRGKAWLQDEGGADLPEHDNALHADAIAASYHYDARQFLVIESKEDIRKRGLRSPDGWDSLILSLASHVRPQENDASDKRWRRKVRSLWGA